MSARLKRSRRTRSAACSATSNEVEGKMTANSSPPMRATMSERRALAINADPIEASAWSPA